MGVLNKKKANSSSNLASVVRSVFGLCFLLPPVHATAVLHSCSEERWLQRTGRMINNGVRVRTE